MDPAMLSAYIDLGLKFESILAGLWKQLKANGVTDEQIAAMRLDYQQRIAAREAEVSSE